MIEGILIVMFYLLIFIGILCLEPVVINVCEYICKRKTRHCPISEDVRCVKIKSDERSI